MSLRPDDESADSDPLLLFATEPQPQAAPAPQLEIPKKTNPVEATPDLEALVRRAETAERLLRESRREAAALKREVATLVGAARNNRVQAIRPAVASALAAACLAALVAAGWRSIPSVAPLVATAVEPAPVAEDEPPAPDLAEPIAQAAPPVLDAPPAGPARALPRAGRESREQFVGTLSVEAVPAGGEVFINRKSVGKAPVRVPGLRAGSHVVWIERAGYRRFTRAVTVPADKVTRVSVMLEPELSPLPRH